MPCLPMSPSKRSTGSNPLPPTPLTLVFVLFILAHILMIHLWSATLILLLISFDTEKIRSGWRCSAGVGEDLTYSHVLPGPQGRVLVGGQKRPLGSSGVSSLLSSILPLLLFLSASPSSPSLSSSFFSPFGRPRSNSLEDSQQA